MNKKMTACALVACSAIAGLTQAEPIIYSDASRSIDMGLYTEFGFFFTPLDIRLPAESQVGMKSGAAPDHTIVFGHRVEFSSSDISWRSIGFAPGDDRVISDESVTVHHAGDPTWDEQLSMPSEFGPLDWVGSGHGLARSVISAVGFTVEYGSRDHYFFDDRFTLGVVLELDDGPHYGFVEFENVIPIGTLGRPDYRPVRWGYETDLDTAIVVPDFCGEVDYDRNGTLDFFDVSAFLDSFSQQQFAADLNMDGDFDFFDVSDFLDAFGAGCP